MPETWIAIDLEDGFKFAKYVGPFASCDTAKAYCQEQEWESWGVQRVDAP